MEQRYAKGERVEAFENEIELPPHLHIMWNIFSDLNSCRQSSQYSYQPLTMTDIVNAFILYEVYDMEVRHAYFIFIKVLDDVWVKYQAEIIKARMNQSKEGVINA